MTASGDKPDVPKSAAAKQAAATEAKVIEDFVKSRHPEEASARLQEDTRRNADFGGLVKAAIQADDKQNGSKYYPELLLSDGRAKAVPKDVTAPEVAPALCTLSCFQRFHSRR